MIKIICHLSQLLWFHWWWGLPLVGVLSLLFEFCYIQKLGWKKCVEQILRFEPKASSPWGLLFTITPRHWCFFCFSFYILYRWDLNIGLLFNNKRLYHFFLVEPTKFLENLRISLVFENIGFCKWYEKSLSPHREEEWWVLSWWEHHTLETIESDFVWYV